MHDAMCTAAPDERGLRDTWVFDLPIQSVHAALVRKMGTLEQALGSLTPRVLAGDVRAKQREAEVGMDLEEHERWETRLEALIHHGQSDTQVPLDWDDLEFFGMDRCLTDEDAPMLAPCALCRAHARDTGVEHSFQEDSSGAHVLFFRPGFRIQDWLTDESLWLTCHQCARRNEYRLTDLLHPGATGPFRCLGCGALHVLNAVQRSAAAQGSQQKDVVPHG